MPRRVLKERHMYDSEIDCPWFDAAWLADHPDFPLAATVAVTNDTNEEEAA